MDETIYCGNNRNILGPDIRVGTNYECLRRGIGGALRQPVDPSYMLPYEPIYDTPRLWCGMDEDNLPDGYDAIGIPPQCLSRGWGIGLAINASRARRARTGRKTTRKSRQKRTSKRRKSQKQTSKRRKSHRRTTTKRKKSRRMSRVR